MRFTIARRKVQGKAQPQKEKERPVPCALRHLGEDWAEGPV